MSCYPACDGCSCVDQPPDDLEFRTVDGLFIKELVIAKAGTLIPQHVHKFDHTSFLAIGRVKVWENKVYAGEYAAPRPIFIKAGVQHSFLSLDDGTILFCIHNLHGADAVEILEEGAILEAGAILEEGVA